MKLNPYPCFCAILLSTALTYPTLALASDYRLVEAQGPVQVRRRQQRNYQDARQGMGLRLGDRLRTGDQAQARILCADLDIIWPMYSNLTRGVAAGCPNRETFDLRGKIIGKQNDNAPGGDDPNIPYIISPRRTAVLDSRLTLRWNPVPGATRYTVQLIGPNMNWETEVSGAEVTYPGTPPLSPAEDYFVVVEPDIGSSSQEDVGANIATFQVLHPRDVNLVQAEVAALAEADLPADVYGLALADIYIREDLLTDAIDTLEPLAAAGSELFEVYQTLGDLYRYVGLNFLAEARYEKAIALASANEDIEGRSAAQAGLAEVKVMLAQPEAVAIELLTQALTGYEAALAGYEAAVVEGEEALDEEVKQALEEELQEQIQTVQERLNELTGV